jgi:hypothetical protein
MIAGAGPRYPYVHRGPYRGYRRGFANVTADVLPALLFGVRLTTAVSLAIFVAFYLELAPLMGGSIRLRDLPTDRRFVGAKRRVPDDR